MFKSKEKSQERVQSRSGVLAAVDRVARSPKSPCGSLSREKEKAMLTCDGYARVFEVDIQRRYYFWSAPMLV